jgi:uncharacterized membrane protein YebE (DUF533 family)
MALLGTLALQALQSQGAQPSGRAPATLPNELPLGLRAPTTMSEENALESKAMVILKAMINAAKADGRIDDAERQRILGKLEEAGADAEAREFVQAEMLRPFDVDGLPEVPNPQTAVEVYAASLLAIAVDTPAERDYLRRLARGLGLEESIVQRLHAALGVA